MKKLLYTTTAFVLCSGIVQANAACIATPSCTSMGYTETSSCDGGLKCPFGSYWYCPNNSGGGCTEFPYLCIGIGYVDGGGIGADCNGKYAKCTCDYGFEWKDGTGCVEITDCRIGSILYSDMSCSLSGNEEINGSKTPIGVVVYVDGAGKRWAMSIDMINNDTLFQWSTVTTDIADLPNYTSDSTASKDFDSCGNTAKIIAAGDKNTYPAAWAAHEYKTAGTEAGDWCLPAAGICSAAYSKKDIINKGFTKIGGTILDLSSSPWSSTEYDARNVWECPNYYSYGIDEDLKTYGTNGNYHRVRPVIEF